MSFEGFAWGEARWLWLLWAAPFVLALTGLGIALRTRQLARFGFDPVRSEGWLKSLRRRRWRRGLLLALALVFLAVAAAQPRTNPQKTRFKATSRDIAVVLDVSRSMLAEDLPPNRLERAKLELEDLCEKVKQHGRGDRLGLVVFAGNSVIKCPLTSNYSYFQRVLRTVDARSASQGGTRIGDAVRKALSELIGVRPESGRDAEGVQAGETVLTEERKARREIFADLLIITDGEDMDSYPLKAAELAASANVGIYAVGLGSEQGSPIPVRGKNGQMELLKARDGSVVNARLDSRTLQDMVNAAPRGQYLPVGTYDFDLGDFYEKTIALEEGREVEEEQVAWTEIFQPFLLAGFAFYLLHLSTSERPRSGQLAQPRLGEEDLSEGSAPGASTATAAQ